MEKCEYLPPESFEGDHVKATYALDIWSLGVIFYELVTGK